MLVDLLILDVYTFLPMLELVDDVCDISDAMVDILKWITED